MRAWQPEVLAAVSVEVVEDAAADPALVPDDERLSVL